MGLFSDVLLTVDYDRTLTAPDSAIPERNITAIRWFIENGGTFTVNTGRSLPLTKVFREKIPTNAPLLLYNGAVFYDLTTQKVILLCEIPMDAWQTVRQLQALFPDLTVEVQGLDAHYNFTPNPMFDAFSRQQDCAYALAQPGRNLGPFLKFTLYGEFRHDTMAHMYEGSDEEIARIDAAEKLLRHHFGDRLSVFRSAPRIIDALAPSVSKAKSARLLQKQVGRKILVCVGDAENDVEMLDAADYAFVPGDAILKDRYENVCKCANGSVADVIYERIPSIL